MAENEDSRGGCGCPALIVAILMLWSLWFGLPTPWGEFHIDLLPPALRLEVTEMAIQDGQKGG